MKLYVLIVLCICLVQTCLGSVTEITEDKKQQFKRILCNDINGTSEKFIDDLFRIYDNYEEESFVIRAIYEEFLDMLFTEVLKGQNISKVDVNSVLKYHTESEFTKRIANSTEKAAELIEWLKIFQLLFSGQSPPERYNGFVNLIYVVLYPNATTKEIESALDYLYGTGNPDYDDPLINFPVPAANDCPHHFEHYSAMQNRLKSMTDIKPVVLRDVATIVEKFPCDRHYILHFLGDFVEILKILHDFPAKKSACVVKLSSNILKDWQYDVISGEVSYGRIISRETLERQLQDVELILSTRLADETFRGIINFQKAVILEAPINEIQRALKYVFVDVPETNCSA